MRLLKKIIVAWLLTSTCCFAKYIARLPQPHPLILEGEIPAKGLCPSEF
jgi:hypothetical protein